MKHLLDAFSHLKFTRFLIDLQLSSLLTGHCVGNAEEGIDFRPDLHQSSVIPTPY